MKLADDIENILRDNGYYTCLWMGNEVPTICLENKTILGFSFLFQSSEELLSNWVRVQKRALDYHADLLKKSGEKAWNIYSIFLAEDISSESIKQIELIEEDFTYTRKIARAGIKSHSDITEALLPLLAIQSHPSLTEVLYMERLRTRLADLPNDAAAAFLEDDLSPYEISKILRDSL